MQVNEARNEVGARPEAVLIDGAKQGDMDAFAQLVRRHTDSVFRMALRITNCHEDAEEVVQDAFLNAFRNLDRFEERSRFSTWLTRIAINTALMKLRNRRHKTVSISEDEQIEPGMIPEQVVDWRPNPEQLYSRFELREILTSTLDSLPDHYRTIFVLRDVEELSTAKTADVLGLSITAVKARLLRARLQLRERLNQYFQCDGTTAEAAAALQPTAGERLRANFAGL